MDTRGSRQEPQPDDSVAWVDGWSPGPALDALQELLQVTPRVRTALAHRLGMHPGDVEAMEHLLGEPMGPVELSRRLGVTSAAATVAVDRLASRGHVVREPDPHDGRRTTVVPTDSGRADVYRELLPMFRALASAADDLTDDEQRVVAAFLARATEAMRALL